MKKAILSIPIIFQAIICFAQNNNAMLSLEKPLLESNFSDQFIIPTDKTAIGDAIKTKEQSIARNLRKREVVQLLITDAENYKNFIENIPNGQNEKILDKIDKLLNESESPETTRRIGFAINELMAYLKDYFFKSSDYNRNIEFPELNAFKLSEESYNLISKSFINVYPLISDQEGNPAILTKGTFTDLKNNFNDGILENLKRELISLINSEIQRFNTIQTEINKLIERDKAELVQLKKKLNEEETQIDNLAIKIGLPLFCITILLLFLGPKILAIFDKDGIIDPKDNSSQSVLLEISTVLLLTMSILILGLSDKINGDVLGTLIGGISGYVLNRIGTAQKTPPEGK